ncbi:MAG: NUDIX hydrolase [Anaerolineae bacterium]|nr:NUDIX hydrolase [Anaerolineae bacterium]
MSYTYTYPRPGVTVDIILLRHGIKGTEILLIQRGHPPFAGQWALPGGFVDEGETLEQAAYRELHEETQIEGIRLQQLAAFGDPGRDPRGWTVSIAFWAWLGEMQPEAIAGDDAANAQWWSLNSLPPLAFDHDKIIATAKQALAQL